MSEMETPAPPAPEPEPDEPVEPEWSGPSREEWTQAQTLLSEYEQLRQQQYQAQQPQQEQGPQPPDPWADDYAQQLEAYVDAKLSFVQQLQQQMVDQEGREAALSFLEKDAATNGPLTDPARVWDQANYLVKTGQAPVPQSDREANQFLADLARQQREYDKKVGEAYHQQQLEQMQTVAGGQRRLPTSQAAAQTVSAGGYGNVPHAVADRFFGGN